MGGLLEIFRTLFRPRGRGTLGALATRAIWRALRMAARRRDAALNGAGPVSLLAVIGIWTGLLAFGFALVYWPRLPESVLVAAGLDPAEQGGFGDALYLSVVTLATLGYGDLSPLGALRVLAPVQGLLGFDLLSAAIAFVVAVTPAAARLRSLAEEVTGLQESRRIADDGTGHPVYESRLLDEMALRVVEARTELLRLPEVYYFRTGDPDGALPLALEALGRLADVGLASDDPAHRLAAARLTVALDRLAETVAPRFLDMSEYAPRAEVLHAWARDHRVEARDAHAQGPGRGGPRR